ncbi:MAG: MBOAT family protein [Oscillospiraceae bacterium]|nr:MBOAT family protein [Oscillospiraceae bacterium]
MVFSSISFLFFFLPLLLAVYFVIPSRLRGLRNLMLLGFSLVFYAWAGPRLVPLVLISSGVAYIGGLFATEQYSQRVRRLAVGLSTAVGLGLLGWYKYAMFAAENLSMLFPNLPVPHVVLPIGISFYTFQSISYVVDIYRGEVAPQKNPLRVALYIALFPQLVAGPIVRYETIATALQDRRETMADFSAGLTRFLFGLAKKMLIANAMGQIANAVFYYDPNLLTSSLAWVGVVAYAMQIYFDFSAYSDMAIGLGRMFGFRFLENFNYPYIARSITDFWRRWHISLSTWFRDYVYIPLGGSRCSKGKLVRNIFIVWLLTGFWHGAAWNFVAWGFWFFVWLIGEKFLWGKVLDRLPSVFRWGYAMVIVLISWVFFRADNLGVAVGYIAAMFGQGTGAFSHTAYYFHQFWPEWILAAIGIFPIKGFLERRLTASDNPMAGVVYTWVPKLLALVLLFLSYMRLVTGEFNPFIYFQF